MTAVRRPMGWALGALLLGISAWALHSGWRHDIVGADMVPHRDVRRLFIHGEHVRTTAVVGVAGRRGLRHTQEARGWPRLQSTGVLSRPNDDPPATWLVGSDSRLDLDILERADRQLILMLAQAGEGRQEVTVFFNGSVLGTAELRPEGKRTRLLFDVSERQQRHGLNHVDLHFAHTTPVTFEGEPGPYAVAAQLFHFGLRDEGQGPTSGRVIPRRVHVERATDASPGGSVLVVPGGSAVRTALRLPDAGRIHLALDIRDTDVAYQLSLVSDGWPRHVLLRGHPGDAMPRRVRCDLAPWAGQPVLLELWARSGDGALNLSTCRLWTEPEAPAPRPQPALGGRRAAGAARPSFLLVVFDALARRQVHAPGHGRRITPALDGLVAKGPIFPDVQAPTTGTLHAVGVLLTGQELGGHGVLPMAAGSESRLRNDAPRLARLLREQGWDTFALVSHPEMAAGRGLEDGFDSWLEVAGDGSPGAGLRLAARLEERLQAGDATPFFGYVHVFEPRAPHDARVRLADRMLEQVVAALARSGREGDTILVLTSAHGEALGEQGAAARGATIDSEELEVPLVFVVPGAAPGRAAGPATLADVAPTLLGLAGLPVPDSMDGIDLTSASPSAGRARLACNDQWLPALSWSRGPLRVVVDLATRRRELFDHGTDPRETRNLWEIRPASAAWLYLELCGAVDEAVATGLADGKISGALRALLRRP